MSLVGLVIGAVAGIPVAPRLISGIDSAPTRMVVGIGALVVLVVVGEVAGMIVGRAMRERPGRHRCAPSTVWWAWSRRPQRWSSRPGCWPPRSVIPRSQRPPGRWRTRGAHRRRRCCAGMAARRARRLPCATQRFGSARCHRTVRAHDDHPCRPAQPAVVAGTRSRAGAELGGQDPWRGAVVPAGAGGQRICVRARAGDDQRARRGRDDAGHRAGRVGSARRGSSCSTRRSTSPSSTSRGWSTAAALRRRDAGHRRGRRGPRVP